MLSIKPWYSPACHPNKLIILPLFFFFFAKSPPEISHGAEIAKAEAPLPSSSRRQEAIGHTNHVVFVGRAVVN